MDYGYMGELMLSMLLFAPGLILFAILLLVGVAMILEKTGVLGAMQVSDSNLVVETAGAANPSAGGIVSSLREAVTDEAEDAGIEGQRKTGT